MACTLSIAASNTAHSVGSNLLRSDEYAKVFSAVMTTSSEKMGGFWLSSSHGGATWMG